jgi:PAS domain S-box-containing protein
MDKGGICNVLLSERDGALYCVEANELARKYLRLPATGSVAVPLRECAPGLADRLVPMLRDRPSVLASSEEVAMLHLDGKLRRVGVRLTWLGEQWLASFRMDRELHQFMEVSLDMLAIANSNGYFEEVSRYFATALGYSPEELCAQPFLSFVHEADRESTTQIFSQLLSGADALGFVNRYRCKDGQFRWLSWHCKAPDETGHMYAVARDITAEKQRSHTRLILERALRDLQVAVVLTDSSANVEWCNPRLCEMTGYSAAELIGKRIGPTLQGADTDRDEVARVRACIAQGAPFSTLLVNYHRSGRPYWVEIEAQPLEYDGELHFLAIEQDVTARVEARLALTRSEQRLRQAIAGSRDAIYLLEAERDSKGEIADFRFTEVNEAAERELSMTREQLIGQSICKLFPVNREAGFFERYRQVAASGQPYSQEYEIPKDRPAPGFYRHFVAKLHNGVVIFNQNLTEIRAQEQERAALLEALRRAQKMEALGQLASAVAHDFNNSLAVMRGTADALRDHPGQDDEARALLDEMCGAVDRARGFVRRLLDFARPAVVRSESVNLSQLIPELCRSTGRTFPSGISLHCEVEPEVTVQAGTGAMEQILGNILANARDAVRGRGQIKVSLQTAAIDGSRVAVIAVRDNGVGMSPDVLARFTDPFFTTKAESGGLGLGMATVLGTVGALGGRLDTESAPGEGTTVRVMLPLAQNSRPVSAPPSPARTRPLRAAKLLLVEDDPHVGPLLRRALARHGYEVSLVTSGGHAISWAEEQAVAPDLAIVDYTMPGMNGVEVARRLHSQWPKLPLLLATGGGVSESGIEDYGIQSILFKPFSAGELIDRVEGLLHAS